jgi:hypothetical protein
MIAKKYRIDINGNEAIKSPVDFRARMINGRLELIAAEGEPTKSTKELEVYETPNGDFVIVELCRKNALVFSNSEAGIEYMENNIIGAELKEIGIKK